ncbi:MAG: hypothetical protein DWQ07_18095 [Chloroflexi bacterium]|nr:MAG: hypothetical protein DWQ07_18095 [Chloroflexota bacterium]
MESTKKFTLGLDAGYIGRWARLILGGIIPLWTIASIFISQRPSFSFYLETLIYFIVVFVVYLAAHYFLGERLLAKVNPWIGTLILVGPPTVALVLGLGPSAFQMGLALYIAISLIFNFIMSYGGCEVMAIPSLIFGQRYVVYCPWNAVDVLDKVIADRKIP